MDDKRDLLQEYKRLYRIYIETGDIKVKKQAEELLAIIMKDNIGK